MKSVPMFTEILQAHVGNLGTQMLVRTRRQKLCSVQRSNALIHHEPTSQIRGGTSQHPGMTETQTFQLDATKDFKSAADCSGFTCQLGKHQLPSEHCRALLRTPLRTQPGSENSAQTDLARTRQSPPWRIWFPSRAASGVPGPDVATLQQATGPWL